MFFISSVYSQMDLDNDILEAQLLQLDSREVNNEFRNLTIDYLSSLDNRMDSLEQKIINNQTVL